MISSISPSTIIYSFTFLSIILITHFVLPVFFLPFLSNFVNPIVHLEETKIQSQLSLVRNNLLPPHLSIHVSLRVKRERHSKSIDRQGWGKDRGMEWRENVSE